MQKRVFTGLLLLMSVAAMAQSEPLQNIAGRKILSLNGRWNYITDPYENGYYDYRHKPYDASASGAGGFYDNKKARGNDLVEYNFDNSPTLRVPADWNSQSEKLTFYEGTIWYRQQFTLAPAAGKKYFLYFGAVNYEAHVYLNGKKIGQTTYLYPQRRYVVPADVLLPGKNLFVVRIAPHALHELVAMPRL